MKPITDLPADAYFRLLLQGEPGSGKTTFACGLPAPYVFDIDGNLGGPVRYRTAHGLSVPVGYNRLDRDEDGKTIPPGPAQFAHFDKCLLAAQADPTVQTIVIDSATGLADMMFVETQRKNPSVKDGRQQFSFFLQDCKRLMAALTSMRKNIVLTAHERVEIDAMTATKDNMGVVTGGTKQFRVVWPGQFGDYIGAFFTSVLRCEVQSSGLPPKYTRVLRTIQSTQHPGLKNDYELAPIASVDDVYKSLLPKMK